MGIWNKNMRWAQNPSQEGQFRADPTQDETPCTIRYPCQGIPAFPAPLEAQLELSGSPSSANAGICSAGILGFPVPSEILEKPEQIQPHPPPKNSTWRKPEEQDFRGTITRLGIILCFSTPSPLWENEDFPKYQEIPLLGSTWRHLGCP